MRFYGSAMRFPHVQGAFRERLIVEEGQCVTLPEGISVQEATFAEPFAVALHAVARAGPLIDRSVLVTGSGPIGALVVLAARVHGAREIVATDVLDEPLAKAIAVGADRAINVAKDNRSMADYAKGKGSFDIVFEASGSEAGLRTGLTVLKARGILIQIGLGGEMNIPQNSIVSKEIDLRGSFRFNEEFALAAALIGTRRVDVKPLLTHLYPLARAVEAFDVAGDRTRAMKVQLIFPDGTA
jgi:L-idonate 5-dehydrogenase